jgi:transposase-like protein
VDTPDKAYKRLECPMSKNKKKNRRPRRSYTPEFKAETVRLVKSGSRTISQVAKDLDLTESALRSWLEKAEEQSVPGALTLDEREELKRLRKENKRLEMEREILKKAAAFFAKENS